jgi:hypothetical protein
VTFPDVPVEGGQGSQVLRLEVLSGGFSLNWIELNRVQVCGTANLARGQSSSASSQESSSYPAGSAFDGDPTTRWSSAFSDPQWIQVDLGAVQNVARVRLIWENAFSRSYNIQFSTNAATWNSVCAITNGAGSIDDLAAVGSARYVRLYSRQRATQYGNSLYEFEVYPALQPASTKDLHPVPGSAFVNPSTPFMFSASSSNSAIATNTDQLVLNGIDVSPHWCDGDNDFKPSYEKITQASR